jgi:abortive infection bacteriophage resistance protein
LSIFVVSLRLLLAFQKKVSYNINNRTRHASRRSGPGRVFLFWRTFMTEKLLQLPLSIDEQIENLKQLNLNFDDENRARLLLSNVSYYRIVKAYSLGLKSRNGKYKSGTTFEQIVELYLFNVALRQLLFAKIERIEISLRARLADYFSLKFGVLGYRGAANFVNPKYHAYFLLTIEQEIKRNKKSPFIKNFNENYGNGNIPFYALVEIMSFGTLSKFFKNLHSADKKGIAKTYNIPFRYLESWIESIAFVRNICAHYGRLYNASFPKKPMLYSEYQDLRVPNDRIFGVLCCVKVLIANSDAHWNDFIVRMEENFSKYQSVEKHTMGFPENWKEILLS